LLNIPRFSLYFFVNWKSYLHHSIAQNPSLTSFINPMIMNYFAISIKRFINSMLILQPFFLIPLYFFQLILSLLIIILILFFPFPILIIPIFLYLFFFNLEAFVILFYFILLLSLFCSFLQAFATLL